MWLQDFGSVWKGIGSSVLGSIEGLISAASPINQLATAYGVVSDPMGAVEGVSAAFREAGNTLSAAASGDNVAAGEIIGTAWFTAVTAAAGGALGRTASVANKGLGSNPFKGKSFGEIYKVLRSRGFTTKGVDPATGKGACFHPETGRKYYLDKGGVYKKGTELPHVDVHRMENGVNVETGKRKYPL